jgi:hypothetical protein
VKRALVHVHVRRARGKKRGFCFRVMYMGKENMERSKGCISGSCKCEKSTWKEERVVFLVHVHVKRARGKKRGLCFRFMYM